VANPERLRVLIHSSYPIGDKKPSGVGTFIQEIVPHLETNGCDVATLGPIETGEKDDADYHLGRARNFHALGTNIPAAVSFNKLKARRVLVDFKPHVIVSHEPAVPNSSHTLYSAIPQREDGKRAIPVIGQFHAGKPPDGLDLKARLYVALAKTLRRPKFRYGIPAGLTMGYVQTIVHALVGRIAVSAGTKDYWREMFPGDYRVIYNGIDVETFTPPGERFRNWGKTGDKNILFAGRPDERKGLEYLLYAFAALRNVGLNNLKLQLAGGDGNVTPRLKEIVGKENIPDVNFLGMLSREELAKAYRSADLLVAPSIGGEGFNRTIAEARVSGTLVVCTDIEGQKEAIGEDLAPFMAKPRDSADLARKIGTVLSLPNETALSLSESSRQDAMENFAWRVIAGKHVGYYDEVIRAHGEPLDWARVSESFARFIPGVRNVVLNDKLR